MTIQFQYCGHIDSESKSRAESIAYSATSENNAWEMVDELDDATADAIWSVGTFTETSQDNR